jgi:hypothetical protein
MILSGSFPSIRRVVHCLVATLYPRVGTGTLLLGDYTSPLLTFTSVCSSGFGWSFYVCPVSPMPARHPDPDACRLPEPGMHVPPGISWCPPPHLDGFHQTPPEALPETSPGFARLRQVVSGLVIYNWISVQMQMVFTGCLLPCVVQLSINTPSHTNRGDAA